MGKYPRRLDIGDTVKHVEILGDHAGVSRHVRGDDWDHRGVEVETSASGM